MNKVESLISKLCPDGVPSYPLKEVFSLRNGYTPSKSNPKFWTDGTVPWFRMEDIQKNGRLLNSAIQCVHESALKGAGLYEAYSIIMSTSATIGEHAMIEVPFLANQRFTVLTRKPEFVDRLRPKFVYYLMFGLAQFCKENTTMSSFAGVEMAKFRDFTIQIPPIQVQDEVISILEAFTELEAELEAELEGRYLQMQHYARAMTEIFSKDELTTLSLAEFAEIGTGSRNTQDAIEGAEYPFYVRSQSPLSIDQYEFDEQAVLTAGDGVGVGKVFHFASGKYALHQRAYRVKPDDSIVDPKFLFYFMKNNFGLYLDSTAVHASVTSLRRPMFEKFEVTFPSLESQRKIVHFLDLLEGYIGDQNGGILAELHARRKQYEYYRNKLLTFKALEAS